MCGGVFFWWLVFFFLILLGEELSFVFVWLEFFSTDGFKIVVFKRPLCRLKVESMLSLCRFERGKLSHYFLATESLLEELAVMLKVKSKQIFRA